MGTERSSARAIVAYRALGHTIRDDGGHDCLNCNVCSPDLTPAQIVPLFGTTDTTFMASNTADGLARWRRWMERNYRA